MNFVTQPHTCWPRAKVKHHARVVSGFPFDSSKFNSTQGTRVIRIRDLLEPNGDVLLTTESVPEAGVKDGDLLIGMDGDFNLAEWRNGHAYLNQRVCRLVPRNSTAQQFLRYALPFHLKAINDVTYSTTVKHLSTFDVGNISLEFPPLTDQRRIAAYLDEATAKIDRLMSLRRRQMELLREQRAALIQQTVTRGLDPHAPLKDSGLPWLGQIPKHWEVKRLKFITSQVTVGIVINPSSLYVEDGVPCLRSLNVRPGELLTENLVFIGNDSHRAMSKSAIYQGDLVAVRTGQPGTTAVVDERFDDANCIDLIIIRLSPHFVSEYLEHVLNSNFARSQFDSGSDGAIQQHFNIQTAKNLFVLLPPIHEQRAILAHIQRETAKLDGLHRSYERQLALLAEYRASLIHECVTGQREV